MKNKNNIAIALFAVIAIGGVKGAPVKADPVMEIFQADYAASIRADLETERIKKHVADMAKLSRRDRKLKKKLMEVYPVMLANERAHTEKQLEGERKYGINLINVTYDRIAGETHARLAR